MKGIIPSQFGKNVGWYLGVVENRADPQQRGRLQVRIHGIHTDDTTLIPTESLPWAIPIQDVTSAALAGVGNSPTGIMEGSMVLVTFLDGNDMQVPAVIGTIGPIEGITGSFGSSNDAIITPEGVQDSYKGVSGNVMFNSSEPPWYSVVKSEMGVKEYVGAQHHPRILEYLKTVGIHSGDETPWCSAFAAWCVKNAGFSISGVSGMAKSWASASCVQKIEQPLKGCIAVFQRPPNPRNGHVTFLDRIQGGRAMCIGGNQGDSVKESGYSLDQLIGWYWPKGHPMDQYAAIS